MESGGEEWIGVGNVGDGWMGIDWFDRVFMGWKVGPAFTLSPIRVYRRSVSAGPHPNLIVKQKVVLITFLQWDLYRYPTLQSRLLGTLLVPADESANVSRTISYEFMNRQLVWSGVTVSISFNL